MSCAQRTAARWAKIVIAAILLVPCACTKAPSIPGTDAKLGPAHETGTATLSWVRPRRNVDGTALSDLDGYFIFYGTSAGNLNHTIMITDPYLTTFTVDGLSPGTYYFNMVAVAASGVRSAPSATVSKTIR